MRIIGADERLNEPRGVKVLLIGPTGVGKTSQLHTLDPSRVLFLDREAGDLSVQDIPVDTVRIDDWATARNIAVRIGGPNPSFAPINCYSEAHYKAVGGALENLDRYDIIFVDSITAISRLSFRWAEQQPEARSERTGAKDLRSTYGLHGRTSFSSASWRRSLTTSAASSNTACRWRARRSRARSAPSSTRSS